MATFDIFNDDAFQVSQLTQTIVDIPRVPTRLGDLGIFQEYGITTTTMMIERKGSNLQLVPTAPRGGVGQTLESETRKLIPVATVHLPQRDSILADVVQGVRAFGSETEVQAMSQVVRQRLDKMKANLDLTHEYQRVGALKGLILDADGSSTILNLYTLFGMTQVTQFWNIATTGTTADPKELCVKLKRAIREKLGGRSFARVRVECSVGFFDKLIAHANMKKAWDLWQQGQFGRTDQSESDFEFGGVVFHIYEGGVGGTDFIEDGFAYAYPEGVRGMFQTAFAPADYMETVNTNGLPYYAKQEVLPFNKGVMLESQSNPVHLNTLPEAVIKLSAAAS
jgi:hypothetical protein